MLLGKLRTGAQTRHLRRSLLRGKVLPFTLGGSLRSTRCKGRAFPDRAALAIFAKGYASRKTAHRRANSAQTMLSTAGTGSPFYARVLAPLDSLQRESLFGPGGFSNLCIEEKSSEENCGRGALR